VLYVAKSSAGEVGGFALSRTEANWDGPESSEVVSLHVLQPDQRQGIGRALIAAIAAKLKRRGHSTLRDHSAHYRTRRMKPPDFREVSSQDRNIYLILRA
jgi:GNAT superfamily N-acetyltransferase